MDSVVIRVLLGGARSGKSALAERMCRDLPAPVTYVATGVVHPSDTDFVARVDAHRARRDPTWATVEATGPKLAGALRTIEGTVLLDSLGTWVAAHPGFEVDVDDLCAALRTRRHDTVIVSEEVGLGVHPSSEDGRRFRDALGAVNVAVAAVADEVQLVVAGRVLPLHAP